ncbi:amine oxidase [flavin-containing] isoform X1 [Parasteatoda tepidariorum]|uniref:amine oxidase [flavin-containing] isoform X1 n=1 Tax=Parasteatoda tepidariorum TaxID=114398 RepID=UPI0039BC89DC
MGYNDIQRVAWSKYLFIKFAFTFIHIIKLLKCLKRGATQFFNNVMTAFITSEHYDASLLGFIWYIKQCGGCKRIFSTTNGGQERKFIGGTQQINKQIAKKLGDAVITGSPVAGIDQSSKDTVIVKTMNGKEYKGIVDHF